MVRIKVSCDTFSFQTFNILIYGAFYGYESLAIFPLSSCVALLLVGLTLSSSPSFLFVLSMNSQEADGILLIRGLFIEFCALIESITYSVDEHLDLESPVLFVCHL